MNKYYEVVSISEKPERDGWYYVLNPNREILPRMIEFKVGGFHNYNKVLASFYLKPIEQLPSSKDSVKQIASDAWDAGIKSSMMHFGKRGSPVWNIKQQNDDKETYLKQFP